MIRLPISSMLALAACVAGAALMPLQSPAGSAKTKAKPSTDGLACSRFEWGSDGSSDKATMRVPISMNGKAYWYQFDTGADAVILYGGSEHQGWSAHGDATRIPNVQFASMSLAAILGYRMKNISDKDIQGTVGLDILVGHTIVIDFPHQRICMMNRADLPDALEQATDWTPAEIRDGKFYVRVELNDKKLDSVLYDSGTSPDELAVDLDLWKDATGKANANEATTRKVAHSWGKQIEIVGAPAKGDLVIGKHRYQHPRLTTVVSRPNNYRDNFYGAQGALGNALFLDSIVVLDLWSHPRFGIISPRE